MTTINIAEDRSYFGPQYQTTRLVSGSVSALFAIGLAGASAALQIGNILIRSQVSAIAQYIPRSHTYSWAKHSPSEMNAASLVLLAASLTLGLTAFSLLRGRIKKASSDLPTNLTSQNDVKKHWSINALLIIASVGTAAIVVSKTSLSNIFNIQTGMLAAIAAPVAMIAFKVLRLKGKWMPQTLPFSGQNWMDILKNDKKMIATALLFGISIGLASITLTNTTLYFWAAKAAKLSLLSPAFMVLATTLSTVSTLVLVNQQVNALEKVKMKND